MQRITLKLGRMRKPVDFVIYPKDDNKDHVVIQGNSYIGEVHVGDADQKATGNGVMSGPHSGGAYFMHLNPVFGKRWNFQLTPEQLAELLELIPETGDAVGPGVLIA